MIIGLITGLLTLTTAASMEVTTTEPNTIDDACPEGCLCRVAIGKNFTICQETGLRSVPEGLARYTNFLDLSGNQIEVLHDLEFRSLGLLSLETISVDGSRVKEVQSKTFVGLRWLKILDLSNNSIVSLDRFVFAENKLLEMVNLSNNPLHTLVSFQFTVLPMLKELDLRNCALSEVQPDAFSNLLFLEILSLRNNSLRTLPKDLFTWSKELKELDLHDNPWRCDCDVQGLVVLLTIRRLYTRDLSCTYESNNKTNLWQHMEHAHVDCVPSIESSVKETLLSVSKSLTQRSRPLEVMDTSKKIFSSQTVETSLLPVALIAIAASLVFLCSVGCYAKCRSGSSKPSKSGCCCFNFSLWPANKNYTNRDDDDAYDYERACYSNYDEDCSDISLTVEL